MDINVSKISNHNPNPQNPDNSVFEMKAQKGIGCLVEGYNLPKDSANSAESKVVRILVECFMKRPSLSSEAMKNIFERANSGLMISQSPEYPSYASASAVFILKNKFVYAAAGDNVIFHFVNGRIADVFCSDPGEEPAYLGVPGFVAPKVGDEVAFSKGNHTFLICSRDFANALDEEVLEGALASSTHYSNKGKQQLAEVKCSRWLKELADNIPDFNGDGNYSAVAFSMPAKKKSKLALIIIIAAIVLVLAAAFFLFGSRRRPPQGPDGGPQGGPGQGQEQMVGPNGETAPPPPEGAKPGEQPEPPTRPAKQ